MSFNREQFKHLITEAIAEFSPMVGGGLLSFEAVNLLLGTAAQESAFGSYLYQVNGPARGVFQMEPATERDLWDKWLVYRADYMRAMRLCCPGVQPGTDALMYNLKYQIIMARLFYRRIPAPLPASGDVEGMAAYWKQYYNTVAGKGTEKEFINNYVKYVL